MKLGEERGKEEGIVEGIKLGEEKGKEEGIVEGIKLGEEKGKEEGIVEGMKLGEEKGRTEGRAEGKIEVAKNLLKAGIAIEVIAKSTDLTVDEIKRL